MDESNLESVMGLIMYGGEAKSNAMEAIRAAKLSDFDLASQKLADAHRALLQAHKTQTEMLTKEANGDSAPLSLLMVHAQDHLMTSITFVDLAKEVVEVYEKFENL
ncbi:lichenan-specific phosphotransferase enzyme iia component (pts system lichenan-specific eiia component) (eiia-lic) (eiii-lic) [Streptococcus pneumoniae]|uniref:PTS lactose/cellobiose transporter subunit IIA n=1 Tax=Streptococcus pneumoniae TaxID=1313 RepID=A0AAP5J7A5_STREE|nr:PTS lactose/cellobiose transporter subunit IIA [Streptococcus pneumoniae]MDS2393663.1 PTS lactose/cellobiose transporter subunit IIA [Streptococcus pneumoniae]MDS2527012.1 PTS lactose/cellobiose transporter subunit IIA [Streptococcus pneumoniae]MDS2636282.1 PTS lactose/cellobiose transporter subunit IIA [Streptococcus pneumoniae]MDS2717528.1 PTS lactose/cellobiose transporter subunit IIA [Streptococcus pneumoniae]MDS2743575.1 PTS lactose/cellobiose transporter subunit IIA [Streptococcus pne